LVIRQRKRRAVRVRNALKRNLARPRLAVFRSHKHIYAQIIDDAAGRTLASAGTTDKELKARVAYGGNTAAAVEVGKAIAARALAAGVKQAAFDRREYKYHGRVAALADAARDGGLDLGAKPEREEKAEVAKKPAKGQKGDGAKAEKQKGDGGAKPKGEKKPKAEKPAQPKEAT
jgi:large subunit ribosomal protein L18